MGNIFTLTEPQAVEFKYLLGQQVLSMKNEGISDADIKMRLYEFYGLISREASPKPLCKLRSAHVSTPPSRKQTRKPTKFIDFDLGRK